MINSFGDKETEKIFRGIKSKKLPPEIQRIAFRKLRVIQAVEKLVELRSPPSNHLEKLKGDLQDYHSIRINRQWRIIFIWKDDAAHSVRIVDYH
ncbi:MAG: type II toxin-antitoxin system RelE/ParE family toxin [Bacteroidota bacterium]